MESKTIKPLGNRVLVKRSSMQKTKGGIFLPESAKEKPKEGKILAVGPGKIDGEGKVIPMELKVGDIVLFGSYSGTEVGEEEEGLLLLTEDDVLAVLE